MSILTKEVEVIPSGKSIKYYRDLGYDAKYLKPLIVKIEDLQRGSKIKIDVLCDICEKNKTKVAYDSYNRTVEKTGGYACKECIPQKRSNTIYKKYGEYNAAKIDEFKNKKRETNLKRYGVSNYSQTKECKEKREATMLERYGVVHNSQLPDYQEKYHKTCIERYGEFYREHFVEMAFNAFYEKTGYRNPSQSPEVKRKIKQTCIDKYGYECNLQSPEVREKITQTLYTNSSQKASRQQRYINELYQGILNFPVKYYNVDIYLPNDNLIIEYDGGFHMGNVVTGRETIEEYKRKEIIRDNVIKREGYKQIKIVSSKDLLPTDPILLQMLSEAKQYFSETPHSWMTFDIDKSRMINAENKDANGISYDFGTLRRIKDSDLPEIENNNNTNLKGA